MHKVVISDTSCLIILHEILDDLKARKLAAKLNLRFTGTLGVIHRAKQIGAIEKVRPIIEKLLATDFRISGNIVAELLRKNNEIL